MSRQWNPSATIGFHLQEDLEKFRTDHMLHPMTGSRSITIGIGNTTISLFGTTAQLQLFAAAVQEAVDKVVAEEATL